MTSLAAALVGVSPSASGQTLSFGGVAGTNLTNSFRNPDWANFVPRSNSLIYGPTIEVKLPRNLAVEVNALSRHLRYSYNVLVQDGPQLYGLQADIGIWEFPLLAKYRLPASKVRPFVELGPSFRAPRNTSGTNPSRYGIAAGAGAEIHLGRWNVAPTVRYTRWAVDPLPYLPTNPNQVDLLIGFSHATARESRRVLGRKLWFGVVAGAPLSGDFRDEASPPRAFTGTATRFFDVRFAAGLTAEVDLTKHLALEVNGLYRRLHFNDGPEVVVTWQIPVLAKYRLSAPGVRPFVEAGPSFRLSGNLHATSPSHCGITAGLGAEKQVRGLKIAPVLRYTRWTAGAKLTRASFQTLTNANQVELLVGFSF